MSLLLNAILQQREYAFVVFVHRDLWVWRGWTDSKHAPPKPQITINKNWKMHVPLAAIQHF